MLSFYTDSRFSASLNMLLKEIDEMAVFLFPDFELLEIIRGSAENAGLVDR